MANLIVIGHLEQSSLDSSIRLFGITISVGWSEDMAPSQPSASAAHPLFPWTWAPIENIQLFGKRGDGTWVEIQKYPIIGPATVALDRLKASAHVRYQEPGISVRWPDPTATIRPLAVNNDGAPWTAQVIELSTSPYPIAQNLNLSFVFKVSPAALGSYSQLAAAPVLVRDLTGAAAMQFGTFQETNGVGFLSYANVGSLPHGIVAMSNLIPATLPTARDWDPQVQKIPLASASIVDWQANFVLGAARLFSVADFVHSVVAQPPQWLTDRFLPTMLDAGVASLRDLIGLGTELGPLAAFGDLQETLKANSSLIDEIRSGAYSNAFTSLKSWKDFLRPKFPALNEAMIWRSSSRDSFGLGGTLRSEYNSRLKGEFAAVLAIVQQEGEASTHSQGLMLAHWNQVLQAMIATPQSQRDAFLASITAKLQSTRKYESAWLDDLIGLFWSNVLEYPSCDDNPYLTRLKTLSTFFVLNRLGMKLGAGDSPANLPNKWNWRTVPQDWLPTGSDLTSWQNLGTDKGFRVSLAAWQDSISANFAPASGKVDISARNPQPVYLQFAQFSKDGASTGSVDVSSDDFFRSIRGVGLLVREQSSGPWYNVNRNGVADPTGQLVCSTAVGIAQRPVYVAELRRSLVSYDSAPGAGGTALDNIKGLEKVMVSLDAVRDPLLESAYHVDAIAVQLKYGRRFDFVGYGVLNSAIVPLEVRADPSEPRGWAATVAHNDSSLLLGQPRSFTYQRTTRVGALRIRPDIAAANSKQDLPVIPQGTFPRGRDLPWSDLWASLPKNVRGTETSLPLALLSPSSWVAGSSPAQNEYVFKVLLPEVTWKEWACWGASLQSRANSPGLPQSLVIPLKPADLTKEREDVIADCFEQCLPTGADPQFLAAVDDPCLERMFYFELFQEVDGTLQVVKTASLSIQSTNGTSGLGKYRSLGARTLCKHAENGTNDMASDAAGSTMTVQVEAGQVCLLRIWACVPAEYQSSIKDRFQAMFAPNVLSQAVPIKLGGRNYFLVCPYDLIVEAASSLLPASDELFAAFSTSYELVRSDYSKSFASARLRPQVVAQRAKPGDSLRGTPNNPGFRFLNIGRADVLRQSWRWDGRPVPLHPALRASAGANFASEEQKWIARVYGEVPDRESLKCRMTISKATTSDPTALNLDRRGCRSFEFSEVLGNSVGAVKADQDNRGAHYRFSLRVFNRYESLLAFVASSDAVRYAHPVPDFVAPNSTLPVSLAWKSVFEPSRVTDPKIPSIRVVLPLTEAYERSESGSPGLLAVFDDIWYDGAGLGDSLEAEIEQIEYKGDTYQQAGKDVLLRGAKEEPSIGRVSDPSAPPVVIDLTPDAPHPKWSGPVGHFKDFDNRAARFLGSSFVVPAPSKKGGLDARNWLLSIRFRRVVYARELPAQATPGSSFERVGYSAEAISQWSGSRRYSAWTDPYWVPLLPEFSRFDDFTSGSHRLANLLAKIDPSTGAVTLTQGVNGAPVQLKPQQS